MFCLYHWVGNDCLFFSPLLLLSPPPIMLSNDNNKGSVNNNNRTLVLILTVLPKTPAVIVVLLSVSCFINQLKQSGWISTNFLPHAEPLRLSLGSCVCHQQSCSSLLADSSPGGRVPGRSAARFPAKREFHAPGSGEATNLRSVLGMRGSASPYR